VKKDFRFVIVLMGAMIHGLALSQGNDVSLPSANLVGTQDESRAQWGRALLNVEDLKTLLNLKDRDPSSAESANGKPEKQEVSQVSPFSKLALNSRERQRLTQQLSQILKGRMEIETAWAKRRSDQAVALKAERRQLQLARTSADADHDAELARGLYKNLIAENALRHAEAQAIESYDQANQLWVDFRMEGSTRFIEAIYRGSDTLWAAQSTSKQSLSAGL
jgi:hypothetical protein